MPTARPTTVSIRLEGAEVGAWLRQRAGDARAPQLAFYRAPRVSPNLVVVGCNVPWIGADLGEVSLIVSGRGLDDLEAAGPSALATRALEVVNEELDDLAERADQLEVRVEHR